MLSRRLTIWMPVAAGIVSLTWALPAYAGVSADSSGSTVTVHASASSVYPKPPLAPRGRSVRGESPCMYTLMVGVDAPVPRDSDPGEWFSVACDGVALNPSDGGVKFELDRTRTPVPTPAEVSSVATAAADSISLPQPELSFNPEGSSVVNLPTWLWINPAIWHAFTASATAAGVTATAVANPEAITWNMGDGNSIVCDGPGVSYDVNRPPDGQETNCSYTYADSSVGQPSSDGDPNDGAYPVTATILWIVTWTAAGSAGGGSLPAIETRATTSVRVEQVESIGSSQ